jgi:uncharacterized protein YdbL (DUF1318 family)
MLCYAAASCSVKFELTSQRTALENQIMGSYKELDDDLMVTSIERPASLNDQKTSKSLGESTLDRAEKNRLFNADDIQELKDKGIIGETADGTITVLPKQIGGSLRATPQQLKLAEALVDEENRDRTTIWKNSIPTTPKNFEKDEKSIREIFIKKIYDSAPSGHWFNVDGTWKEKS